MPINERKLINAIQELAELENLRVCVKESIKGACMAGGGALIGAILGCPIGLAVGGTLASVYAAYNSNGKLKPVAIVISELTPEQRIKLASSLERALLDVQAEDALKLIGLIMASGSLKAACITQLCLFLRNEMGLALAN